MIRKFSIPTSRFSALLSLREAAVFLGVGRNVAIHYLESIGAKPVAYTPSGVPRWSLLEIKELLKSPDRASRNVVVDSGRLRAPRQPSMKEIVSR